MGRGANESCRVIRPGADSTVETSLEESSLRYFLFVDVNPEA